jgi:hypothetical protein
VLYDHIAPNKPNMDRNVEEANKAARGLRMDVDATQEWCQQLRSFIENTWPNGPDQVGRSAVAFDASVASVAEQDTTTPNSLQPAEGT